MKKRLLLIEAAVLLLAVGLSGCTENSSNFGESKFIGTWIHHTILSDDTWIFFENGTAKIVKYTSNFTDENDTFTAWSNYSVDDRKLSMTISQYTNYTVCHDYEFSNEGNRLTLKYLGVRPIVLSKIQ